MDAKKALASTKNFVKKHQTALAVTATAAVGIAVNRIQLKNFNEFLEEKGLLEEFWTPEDN